MTMEDEGNGHLIAKYVEDSVCWEETNVALKS